MEKARKEPYPRVVKVPMMVGVNLPWIEVPKIDVNILNWWPFSASWRLGICKLETWYVCMMKECFVLSCMWHVSLPFILAKWALSD